MINTKDQEELLKLIADYLKKDVSCYAIGGTAMMFYGYKNATKDIDLVFLDKADRDEFIRAIKELGYSERSMKEVYDEKRQAMKSKPLMFSRGDERFDLFLFDVLGFEFRGEYKEQIKEKRVFISDRGPELTVNLLPIEFVVLLKAITSREKDMEDIKDVLKIEKNLDWGLIIDEAVKQRGVKGWILYDLEEKMQELKKVVFIPSKYFERIYEREKE